MADEIIIRTSDSPAKELRASRAVLAAHSTVFKDLFSMPNTAQDAFVEVAETVEELAPFLSILTGTYDEPLELSADGWVHLARLADKYDAKIARSIVEGQVSRLLKDDEDEALTLILASYIRDADLAKDAAFAFMFANDADCAVVDGFEISADLRRRLARWCALVFEHAQRFAYNVPEYFTTCGKNTGCSDDAAKAACYEGIFAAMRDTESINHYNPYSYSVEACINRSRLCKAHAEQVLKKIRAFEGEYRDEAPPFPA